MSASPGSAVATNARGGGSASARATAYRLLPAASAAEDEHGAAGSAPAHARSVAERAAGPVSPAPSRRRSRARRAPDRARRGSGGRRRGSRRRRAIASSRRHRRASDRPAAHAPGARRASRSGRRGRTRARMRRDLVRRRDDAVHAARLRAAREAHDLALRRSPATPTLCRSSRDEAREHGDGEDLRAAQRARARQTRLTSATVRSHHLAAARGVHVEHASRRAAPPRRRRARPSAGCRGT